MRGHRVGATVPAVEFADDTDPCRIRRPAGKTHAADPVTLLHMAAKHAIRLLQPPLIEQIQIVRADGRRVGVRVYGLEFAAGFFYLQSDRTWWRFTSLPSEDAQRMDALHGRETVLGAYCYAAGVRPEHTQRPVRTGTMQAEHAERIMVTSLRQSVEIVGGRQLHGGSHRGGKDSVWKLDFVTTGALTPIISRALRLRTFFDTGDEPDSRWRGRFRHGRRRKGDIPKSARLMHQEPYD